MDYQRLRESLLCSKEPMIAWKARHFLADEEPSSPKMRAYSQKIRTSARVQALLGFVDQHPELNPFQKWQGPHWQLLLLSDSGYPMRCARLAPHVERILSHFDSEFFERSYEAHTKAEVYLKKNRSRGIARINQLYRICASYQANTILYCMRLGFVDERLEKMVNQLIRWQWPDGGWNCDKNPEASHSTFIHSLPSLLALELFGRKYGHKEALTAAAKAKEFFLKRRLYKRASTGKIVHPKFTFQYFPRYWHYDYLGALKVFAELGALNHERCRDALDLLESKQLKAGGWAAEKNYYKVSDTVGLGHDVSDWGPTGKTRMNEWVTVEALWVLKTAGRIKFS